MPPANPLRLQVIDRIIAVLSAIVAGDNYFFTPHEVTKRDKTIAECVGFPSLSVFLDSGGKIELAGACGDDSTYDDEFHVCVCGVVDGVLDTVSPLVKVIRDVRKAIDDDSRSGAAGSLGVLCVECRIEEEADTDNGNYSAAGIGLFYQRIRCRVSGNYGEL